MATYASTGAAGVDVEVDYAALLAVRLIAERRDPALPAGAVPIRLSLQRRDGPPGFDDMAAEWSRAGSLGMTYLQSKRVLTVGTNTEFSALAKSLAEFDDERDWSAAIVTGSLSPSVSDVQDVLESARLSGSSAEFDRRWSEDGVLNPAKRQVLRAFTEATAGLPEGSAWRAMRALRVIEHDLNLPQSRDRQAAVDLLAGQMLDGSMAEAGYASLRSTLLAAAQRAPTFDRPALLAAVPSLRVRPADRLRPAIDHVLSESEAAIAGISCQLRGGERAVTLLRPGHWSALRHAVSTGRTVRLTGEAGCGKSGLLARLAATFQGAAVMVSERRISARTWSDASAGWGIPISAEDMVSSLGSSGACLLAIDGADRMLLDDRREVVVDLLAAVAASPLRERWTVVTSGRDLANRDPVRDALRESGLGTGEGIAIGSLDDDEATTLSAVFPAAATLLARSDLVGLNRNPFMLKQMLGQDAPPNVLTEVGLADAWATRGAGAVPPAPGRDAVVGQLASARLASPAVVPGVSGLDPAGLAALLEEGSAARLPLRDGIVFTHDVLEDWALARELQRDWQRMAERLRAAGQPPWWQRSVRLAAQMLLEAGCDRDWSSLLDVLEEADLDPAWRRQVLAAPLYSERSAELLARLQETLLDDSSRLLRELIDTLRVAETRIPEGLLDSSAFAELSEADRFRMAAHFKKPVVRPWLAFMRWSLPQWRSWPETLLFALVELAEIWTQATEPSPNWISQSMAAHASAWLVQLEDHQHTRRAGALGDSEEPFALSLGHHEWQELESTLRRILTMAVSSAPRLVQDYLERVTADPRLREPRESLLKHPRRVPSRLPRPWTELMTTELLRRRRQRRDGHFRSSCFDSPLAYHEAGIRGRSCFNPSSPLQAGWDQLFETDPDAALETMHRLEMRAAVFWRNWSKRGEGRRPIPLTLHLPTGPIRLWGDETAYRWSRAILGPTALGSAYLALDDWLDERLAAGDALAELLPRVLQNNGLVATAAPIINAAAQRQSDRATLSAIAPFLASPRLWSHDVRRHIDDRSPTHRMSLLLPSQRHHVEATEKVWQRYSRREPLHHQLLMPFLLLADQEAQALLQERRIRWRVEDLADYEDELGDAAWRAEHEEVLERFRSDADPASLHIEDGPEPNQFAVRIEPPAPIAARAAATEAGQRRAGALGSLAAWAERSLEDGAVRGDYDIQTAMSLLEAHESPDDADGDGLPEKFSRAASAGVASVLARFGDAAMVEEHAAWLRERLWTAVARARTPEESMFLMPETLLTLDPQMLAAGGLAALASRGLMPDLGGVVAELATIRPHAVSVATLRGLDWDTSPDFAWRCLAAALDMCVFDLEADWLTPSQRRRAQRRNLRRAKAAAARVTSGPPAGEPLLPPRPYRRVWRRSGRAWPPLTRVLIRSAQAFDWGRAKSLLEAMRFDRLDASGRVRLRDYLNGLAQWAIAHRDVDDGRLGYHDGFPYELASILAHALGRLTGLMGDGESWRRLLRMDYRHREGDLVGHYLREVAIELIESGRAPDERFWSAWRPAADWAMDTLVPRRRDDDWDNLPDAVRAAGFVGPYMCPLPPDWPHLHLLLPTIDQWTRRTADHAAAARAMLAIGERMSADERERWLLPWLEEYSTRHGRDRRFWQYASLGDGAAGLLPPLALRPAEVRQRVARVLSNMADAGSASARELLPLFAAGRRS